jgi:hypothetical protein
VRSAQRYIQHSILAFVFLCTLLPWFPGLLHEGKAHKDFICADPNLAYAINTMDKDRILDDTGIYYPKVLKGIITRERARP